jgi:hypothetical protein
MLIGPESTTGLSAVHNVQDSMHTTKITLGNQTFTALLDTGSADTWVTGVNFNCTRGTDACNFGASYTPSSSFILDPRFKMDTLYGTGERLEGNIGQETVTFGNVTVHNQTIGVMYRGSWVEAVRTSGIIGMAFATNTRKYAALADPYSESANPEDRRPIPYNPLFTTMHQQGLIKPYFSLALNRVDESPGVLALGGLPGDPIRYSNTWAKAKFQFLTFENGSAIEPELGWSLYTIHTEGYSVDARNTTKQLVAFLDSGSPLIYVPRDVARKVNTGWKPAAKQDRISSKWIVDCDAVPPNFGIIINGTNLMVDVENMAVKGGIRALPEVKEPGRCLSAVQEASVLSLGLYVLGTPFLKSVVAVFDVGAAEMRFAQRIR